MTLDINTLVTGRKVKLEEMLLARDRRQDIQQQLIEVYHLPVISFTLNIVGPVKVFPLARQTFYEGVRLIESQCRAWNIPVIHTRTLREHTGYEQFWAVKGEIRSIKEILCLLEDSVELGRLFDIDIIQPEGTKISRTDLGFSGRKCLICNQDAFVCSRSRAHPVEELLIRECGIMNHYFSCKFAAALSSLSMEALLYEVSVTPKPGLVDRNNNGSHNDMDIFTFEASAVSLNSYFEKFALCGILNSHEPLSRIFARLRSLGIQAEDAMFQATNHVNTHKGLIFALGVMNCSLGYLYANDITYSPETLLDVNRRLVQDVLEDFRHITPENARTNGERLYALHGMKGARGEALSGYETVLKTALPRLKEYLHRGLNLNDAGALTLLSIIAYSEDTNIVNRSSYERMKEVQGHIRSRLNAPGETDAGLLEYACQLDQLFIKDNLSPGGSADLLALTFFVYLYEKRLGPNSTTDMRRE